MKPGAVLPTVTRLAALWLLGSLFVAGPGRTALGQQKPETPPTSVVRPPEVTLQNLQLAWRFKRAGAAFLSAPVWRDGRLYGASCDADGSIFCLDAATGNRIWEVEKMDGQALKGIFSSPALTADGHYLLIGEGLHPDAGSHLICLEAATGKLHWKLVAPKNHIESSPAISGDIVVVGAGAIERPIHLPQEAPGFAMCVRISDGRLLWQRPVIDAEGSPALRPDKASYFGSGVGGNAVIAFDAAGATLWKKPTSYPATGHFVLYGSLAIVGSGRGDFANTSPQPAGAVLALEQNDGRPRWIAELGDAVLGRLTIRDGMIFCPVRDGTVAALNAADGKILWRQRLTLAPVLAGTAWSGGRVFAVSSDGLLAVLDAKTGRLLEKHPLNDGFSPIRRNLCTSTPLVVDGRLFVGSESGGMRCYVSGPAQ